MTTTSSQSSVATPRVTEFFRDPFVFKALARSVAERLGTREVLHVVHFGVSSGEEALSCAILLEELGLLTRAKIHATDRKLPERHHAVGTVTRQCFEQLTQRYSATGGRLRLEALGAWSETHFHFSSRLTSRIHWSEHDICRDAWRSRADLVFCRNVMIHLSRADKERAITTVRRAVAPGGILCAGLHDVNSRQLGDRFVRLQPEVPVYERVPRLLLGAEVRR